jgi:2-polyprenyl-6-methoxyphenol hydroxylase-like FAD-dependent oxidoreductase
MPSKNFRVIIAGGSISGLALAIMLEKNGIDFLVLEAYPEIAPQVGASIALLPNSFRILDQIGCYEDMMKLTVITTHLNFRRPDGTLLTRIENIGNRKVQRFVYCLSSCPLLSADI